MLTTVVVTSLHSTLFTINIDFNAATQASSRPNISSKILADPDVEKVVKLSSYETYAHHLRQNNLRKDDILRSIGNAFVLLRNAGPDPNVLLYAHANLLDLDDRNPIIEQLNGILDELDRLGIEDMPVTVDPDAFMELLMNNIRNEVISYQSYIFKKIKANYNILLLNLSELKQNYQLNFNEISRIENQLRIINEIRINSELENNSNFELINSERITPFFLKMIKGSMLEKSLRDVKDYNGLDFANKTVQREFIV